jgi:hypothetical protein
MNGGEEEELYKVLIQKLKECLIKK